MTSLQPLRVGLQAIGPKLTHSHHCAVLAAWQVSIGGRSGYSTVWNKNVKQCLPHASPVTYAMTSSFHTSSRCDVSLSVPGKITALLGNFDKQKEQIKTTAELSAKRELLFKLTEISLKKMMSEGASSAMGDKDRLQLPWYRQEAQDWAVGATKAHEAFWGEAFLDDKHKFHKDANKTLAKLVDCMYKQGALREHTPVMHCKVKIIDPEVIYKEIDGVWQETTSFPDGSIYITLDFMKYLCSLMTRNKLAFVLAKEMTRIYLEHQAEQWSIPVTSRILSHHFAYTLTCCMKDNWKGPADKQRYVKRETLVYMRDLMKLFPDEYSMEYETDKLAMQWAKMSGFDPASAKKLMRRDDPMKIVEPLAKHDGHPDDTEISAHIDRLYRELGGEELRPVVDDHTSWIAKIPDNRERLEKVEPPKTFLETAK